MIKGAIIVDTERCKGCNLCAVACPKNVIEVDPRRVNRFGLAYAQAVRADDCIGCAACGIVCPDGCITVYKQKI
ncbi:MAG: 4Fe-4S binding protein [Prevotella sp.]|nr:4Fe-4S binding protein [Prevotella sp.]MCD8306445.1 4Fe-4S binding protein [Prevotella sp.]